MRVHQAIPDRTDWAEVHDLITEAFSYITEYGLRPKVLTRSPDDLRRDASSQHVVLASDAVRVVGCVFARPSLDFKDAFYLGRLAVAESQRGKGVARRLIDAVAKEAKIRGHASLVLDTSVHFLELYKTFERLGFRPVPNPQRALETDIISFQKHLARDT